jgi:holo-[acyl-carrier protein] synthase
MEIGVDCVEISRFSDILSDYAFQKKVFTREEIEYCSSKKNSAQHFAVRFAGKEAIIKALSNYNIKVQLNQIEILNDSKGQPYVNLLNSEIPRKCIKISLSHSNNLAIGLVIIQDFPR